MDAILELVNQSVILQKVVLVLIIARAVNKPLFSLLHAYVNATPWSRDNQLLAKIEASKIYKGVCWVLDYLFSIKLIK